MIMGCCGAYGWCFRRYDGNNNRHIVEYADEDESAILEVTKTVNVSKDEAERLVDRYW